MRRDNLGRLGALDAATLQQLAAGAGFSGSDIQTAAAIALAESSGNPSAIGDNGTSYGLWQIHVTAWPQFKSNPQALLDPATNAAAAFTVYQQQGWTAWTTYNTGAYLAYMQPLTIDASTGQPIADGTPTPDASTADSTAYAAPPSSPLIEQLAIAAGVFIAGKIILEDLL